MRSRTTRVDRPSSSASFQVGQRPRALGVAVQRVLEREADRAGDLLAGRARVGDRRPCVGERIAVGTVPGEQFDPAHGGRGVGEQLLHRRQRRER